MVKVIVLIAAAAAVFWLMATCASKAWADPPAICCNQPSTDQFEVAPYGNLDPLNPLSKKVRETGAVVWAYLVMPGCNANSGSVLGSTIGAAMGDIYYETGVIFQYVTGGPSDLTIRTNCGSSFSAVCGNGAAACLGRQFPYVLDIDFSQDVASYFDVSRISVVLHELFGHALATWNEGYCTGANASLGCNARFDPVPNYVDVMNTGVNSRHYLGTSELARWGRTMGSPAPASYGVGNGYVWFCGVSSRAVYVDLFGAGPADYRYIGTVPLSNLQINNGCYGLATAFYIRQDECAAIRIGNYADFKNNLFRSDRVVCG